MTQNENLPEEYLLARRAKLGDQEALGLLAERLRVPLFGLAYAELHHYEDAQDVVASSLLQICLHIKELREPARMRSWTWEVARNEVRRLVEKRRARNQSEAAWQILEDDTFPPFLDVAADRSQILRLDIERALQKLPTSQAEAMSLHYLLGHTVDEIAERFGRPPGTVKSWLHHARHRLAHEMEAYSPTMKDKSSPRTTNASAPLESSSAQAAGKAVILQTDMEAAILTKLTNVLREGGFHVSFATPEAIYKWMDGTSDTETTRGHGLPLSLLVLDEAIRGRPALEYLVNLKAQESTRSVPVCVLLNAAPSQSTAAAYFGVGAARLLVKSPEETFKVLENPQKKPETALSWVHFTEKARRVVYFAQVEARRFKHNSVTPEHLLLGLTSVPDSVGARILTDKLGASLEALREVIEREASQSRGTDETPGDMQLDPDSKRVIELAYEEADFLDNNYIGVEHLLLGLIRKSESAAARTLRSQGVEIEATRNVVREWQQNPE